MINEQVAAAALKRSIDKAGGQAALGRICGCSQGAIWQMLQRDPPQLSARYVLRVEAATGVPRWELRPDIYPPDLGPGPEATLSVAAE